MNEKHSFQSKPLKCMFGVAMAGTAMLALPQGALAVPTTLVCNMENSNGQITIDLDASSSTATINYPGGTTPSNPPISFAARSVGPLAAQFDPKSVTFDKQTTDYVGAPTQYEHFTIDRVTGSLQDYISAGAPWDQAQPRTKGIWKYSCHVGTTQF